MSLKEYKKKRSFKESPEPEGNSHKENEQLVFVVQKHDASHLHYDFRLEMRGVLKSWAVPKGPSMNPADKRLAMMVEDHPFDYKDFEGIIPEGNYGAGTVIVWDQGTYTLTGNANRNKKEQEKQLLAELHSGSLHITLKGKKLKGEFVLVKSKNAKAENAWLLIKKSDRYSSEKDISKKDKSVLSSKSIDQVAKTSKRIWKSNRDASGKKKDTREAVEESSPTPITELLARGRKSAMPKKLKPMLATLTKDAFDDELWIYEVKWDGYRALAFCNGKKVELRSRNELAYTKKFHPVSDGLAKLGLQSFTGWRSGGGE